MPYIRMHILTASLALACCLIMPQTLQAQNHGHYYRTSNGNNNHRASSAYLSAPSAGFAITFGTGYAGNGYYYGPPNSSYYYQRPGVIYYATREAVPRDYYSRSGYEQNSMGVAVQRALARNGYYNGYIDGQIGPQSRRAIARYQQRQGLRVTGNITPGLLRSLGL